MILKLENKPLQVYNCDLPKIEPLSSDDDSLQLTEEWFRQKTGRFSGSEIKKLVSCSRATAKMLWERPEKIIDFSDTAKNYVYKKAMERKTGIFVRKQDILNFKYGRLAEKIIVEKFKDKMPHIKEFKDVPFILVKGHEDYLGASPDGALLGIVSDGKKKYGFEAKGAMSWETFGTRIRKPMDESHLDFWQIQLEMLALEVNTLYYCVSYPVVNAIDFVDATYEEAFDMIKDIAILEVTASSIHQSVILKRAEIGNNAINFFLQGMTFDEAMQKACTIYKFN